MPPQQKALSVSSNFMTNLHTQFYVRTTPLTIKDSFVEDELKLYGRKNKVVTTKLPISERFKLEDEIIKKLLEQFSETAFETYKLSDYSSKCKIAEKAIERKNSYVNDTIRKKFKTEPTEFSNAFFIDIGAFRDFLECFSETTAIDWTNISKNPYYDWDIGCLKVAQNVLDWTELLKNKTTTTFFTDTANSEELIQMAKDHLLYEGL